MTLPRTGPPAPDRPRGARRRIRTSWAAAAVPLVAFTVFEAVKHGGWSAAAAAAGFLLPGLPPVPGVFGARPPGPPRTGAGLARDLLLRHPVPPVALMTLCVVLAEEPGDNLAAFNLGLAWLTRTFVDRALAAPTARLA